MKEQKIEIGQNQMNGRDNFWVTRPDSIWCKCFRSESQALEYAQLLRQRMPENEKKRTRIILHGYTVA